MIEKIKDFTFYLIVGVLVVYIALSFFNPDKLIDIFRFRPLVVLTTSMEPEIYANDVIILKHTNESDLEEGDIITFKVYIPELREKGFVTHYIAAIETDTQGNTIYKTQGAGVAPDDFDEWEDAFGTDTDVTFNDIEGQYLFRIPIIGYITALFNNSLLLALVITNGFLLFITVRYIKNRRFEDDY